MDKKCIMQFSRIYNIFDDTMHKNIMIIKKTIEVCNIAFKRSMPWETIGTDVSTGQGRRSCCSEKSLDSWEIWAPKR